MDGGCRSPCHAASVPKNYFDERIAKSYEAKWPELFRPEVVEAAVRCLADLAGTGAALELGIGTGRLAIPLSQRASVCTGSTCRRTWSRSCGPSRAPTPSA
jgi:hypothetical protein